MRMNGYDAQHAHAAHHHFAALVIAFYVFRRFPVLPLLFIFWVLH
jgi:hypothetical protein